MKSVAIKSFGVKELLPNLYQATTIIQPSHLLRLASPPAAMHIIKVGNETVLIDPFVLPECETKMLEELGQPTSVLISNSWHERDALFYRQRYGAKILANHDTVAKFRFPIDDTFDDKATLPGGLTAVAMPGTLRGETIFQYHCCVDALIVADAIFNLDSKDRSWVMKLIGFPTGLGTMPKFAMRNKSLAVQSYERLFDLDFDQLLVSHGSPILSGAKEKLRAALEKSLLSIPFG